MTKAILFLGVLIAMGVASPEAQASNLRKLLNAYAEPLVRVTSREIHVYHYAPRSNIAQNSPSPIRPKDRRIHDYVGYLKELFWSTVSDMGEGGNVGYGFYVAIDPATTVGFGGGGTDWVLIQTVLPKGTRFLDATPESFSKTLQDELAAAGCSVWSLDILFGVGSTRNCKKIRDRLVRDFDIMGIRYTYMAGNFRTICKQDLPQVSMVLFDDRAINWDRLIAMTSEIPDRDPQLENRLIIQAFFQVAGAGPLWPSLQKMTPSTNVKAWARQTIMGCGDYAEDAWSF